MASLLSHQNVFLHEKTLSLTEINSSAGIATAQSRGTLGTIYSQHEKIRLKRQVWKKNIFVEIVKV